MNNGETNNGQVDNGEANNAPGGKVLKKRRFDLNAVSGSLDERIAHVAYPWMWVQSQRTQHDTLRHDRPQHDTPHHDTPRHDMLRPDTPRHDASHHDTPQHDSPHNDTLREVIPPHDMAQHDRPQNDTPSHDTPLHDKKHPKTFSNEFPVGDLAKNDFELTPHYANTEGAREKLILMPLVRAKPAKSTDVNVDNISSLERTAIVGNCMKSEHDNVITKTYV